MHIDVRTVRYPNLAWESAAHLYLPSGFSEAQRYPAIVSSHPIGSCKEQTAGNVYAKALAEAGFVVIVPDASFQGDSGGALRHLEDPHVRTNDISFAIDHLMSLPFVDEARIGALGVCGGGGYTVKAAMQDRRIRALVTITGVNFGRLVREGFSQFDPIAALDVMARLRTAEARGQAPQIRQYLPPNVQAARDAGYTDRDVLEAVDYYKTARAAHHHGASCALESRLATSMVWDAFAYAETLLTQPLMVVVGAQVGAFGAYRDGLEIHGRAASKDKHLVIIQGASHYDLYDRPTGAGEALDRVIPFLEKRLKG